MSICFVLSWRVLWLRQRRMFFSVHNIRVNSDCRELSNKIVSRPIHSVKHILATRKAKRQRSDLVQLIRVIKVRVHIKLLELIINSIISFNRLIIKKSFYNMSLYYKIDLWKYIHIFDEQGAVSIRKTVLPGMAIPMLKIRRPNGRLIFNMEIAIRR